MTEDMINPDTGRNTKGQFAKGHKLSAGKRNPREITKQIRAFAAENKVTEKAIKQLVCIVENKDGRSTPSDIIRASDLLLKTFNISVAQDVQNQHEDEQIKSYGEMFADLKGMQK